MRLKTEYVSFKGQYIKRSSKPIGSLRVETAVVVPMGRGLFYLSIGFNVRGVEVVSYSSGGKFKDKGDPLYEGITFSIHDDIWVKVTLYPEISSEVGLSLFGQLSKASYDGVLIPSKLISRSWDRYCGRGKYEQHKHKRAVWGQIVPSVISMRGGL